MSLPRPGSSAAAEISTRLAGDRLAPGAVDDGFCAGGTRPALGGLARAPAARALGPFVGTVEVAGAARGRMHQTSATKAAFFQSPPGVLT